MVMAGQCTPHFLFSVAPKRENGPCTVQKRKGAGVEFDRKGQIRPSTGAGLNRCQCELPVLCRLRLTPFLPEPLRRSWDCLRGCFASLTEGPLLLFPRFAPGWSHLRWTDDLGKPLLRTPRRSGAAPPSPAGR